MDYKTNYKSSNVVHKILKPTHFCEAIVSFWLVCMHHRPPLSHTAALKTCFFLIKVRQISLNQGSGLTDVKQFDLIHYVVCLFDIHMPFSSTGCNFLNFASSHFPPIMHHPFTRPIY